MSGTGAAGRRPARPARRVVERAAVAIATAAAAALGAACDPRVGEFELTNETDAMLLFGTSGVAPGTTESFEVNGCFTLEVFTQDATQRASFTDVCERDHVIVTADELRAAAVVSVVNATDEPLDVRYAGEALGPRTPLGPGEEVTIPLTPDEATCRETGGVRPELAVVRPLEPDGEAVVARYWDVVCAGTRWVVDDAALAHDAPATVRIVNATGVGLEVASADAVSRWAAPVRVLIDGIGDLLLDARRGSCQNVSITGRGIGQNDGLRVREDLLAPCDGELVIERADLVHQGEGGAWVPLDPAAQPTES